MFGRSSREGCRQIESISSGSMDLVLLIGLLVLRNRTDTSAKPETEGLPLKFAGILTFLGRKPLMMQYVSIGCYHNFGSPSSPRQLSSPPLSVRPCLRQSTSVHPARMSGSVFNAVPIPAFTAMNRIRVMRLYRRALKLQMSWTPRYDVFRSQAMEIRRRFEANQDVSDPRSLQKIIENAEKELYENRHPDPYIRIYPIELECTNL